MRAVFFIPPLAKLSGGLTNIYAVAANLRGLGRDAVLIGPSDAAPGLAEAREAGLAFLPWGSPLAATDLFCLPEGWPNALSLGVNAGARVLVYVQNWAYLFGQLPKGVRWSQLPVEYLAVSRPVANFMRQALGLEAAGIVPPVVDECFFTAGTKAPRPSGHIRVAWMPRKNSALGEQVRHVAEACLDRLSPAPRVEWVRIQNVSRTEVARLLSTSHIFLSTGFPEGFALPPLEAMASGCVPVGFTGFGGWEYMRQAKVLGRTEPYAPPEGLAAFASDPAAGEPGNGLYSADGDSLAAGMALARAVRLAAEGGRAWTSLVESGLATAKRYDREAQKKALQKLFPE